MFNQSKGRGLTRGVQVSLRDHCGSSPQGREGRSEEDRGSCHRVFKGCQQGENCVVARPPVTGLSRQKGVLQCNLFRMQMERFVSCGLKPLPGRASAALNVGFLLVTAHCRPLTELRMVFPKCEHSKH